MSTIMFGMVQGRLTQSPPGYLQWFPQDSWQDEFNTAASIGVNYIELIAEVQHNPENPIWTDAGISKIKQLVKKNDLTLHALCNDYIVEHSFLDEDSGMGHLHKMCKERIPEGGLLPMLIPQENTTQVVSVSLVLMNHQPHRRYPLNLLMPHYRYYRYWGCCYFLQTHRSSSIVKKLKVKLHQDRSSD